MKEFFEDIFAYHHYFNQKLADIFIENYGKLSDRTIPLFSHTINAHQIWNSRILIKSSLGVHQLHTLDACKNFDDSNYSDTLSILAEYDLSQRVNYVNSKGGAYEHSIQEILFHICNHFTHHKGQLISDLRLSGIEPPITDYIFYKK